MTTAEQLTANPRARLIVGKTRQVAMASAISISPSSPYLCRTRSRQVSLTLTYPVPGENQNLSRILIGMTDAYTGIDLNSFQVTADFELDGVAPDENLVGHFKALPDGRWERKLNRPIADLPAGTLTVSIKDRQGNINSINRKFSVTSEK